MKNTFRILFAFVLALSMCVIGSAITLDTVECASETNEITEASLSEVSATVVPGINLITGTTAPFSFEDVDTSINIGVTADNTTFYRKDKNIATVSNAVFWTKATPDNNKNKAMALYGSYPHFTFENTPVVEAERPVQVYFNYINDDGDQTVLLVRNAGNSTSPALKSISVSKSNGAWISYNAKLESNKIAETNKGSPATYFKDDTNNIKNIWFMRSGTTNAVYLDDIALVPYYKVTYIGLDGKTVAATDYVLLDAAGNMLTSYTPDNSKVEGATGYALSADGERVASVALNNADIKLYALDTKEVSFVSGDITKNVNLTEGSYTIPTAKELGIDVENFRLWTDGASFYHAGDVIADALTLKGKTLTALCFEEKLFDPVYGDLVFLYNYEGKTDWKQYTYLNPAYATQTGVRSDGSKSITVETASDGTSYMKVANSTSGYQLYGYGIYYSEKTVGGKATVTFDWSFVNPARYAGKENQLRMLNKTVAPNQDGHKFLSISRPSEIVANEWYTAVVQAVDTTGDGWKGGVVQYSKLSTTDTDVITNIDNYAFYLYPAKTFVILDEKGSESFTKVTASGDTYTFEAKDGVLAWMDENGNYYKPGIAYNVSDLQFKVLYPYTQNADVPAVIFKFEGDAALGGNLTEGNCPSSSDKRYSEAIIDDGRNVLHLHAWDKSANKDYRVWFKSGDAPKYDVNEYKHFQFMYKANNVYKVDSTSASGYSAQSSWDTCVYVNYNGNGGYYRERDPYVLYQFNKNGITSESSDDYIIFEKDLSTISTKEGYPIGYGFTIDPVNTSTARYGHDIYIDYVRVYRAGVTTVTYATNAPDGANLVYEVPADENRGLGTGYLLKGERPAVEGYKFMGWALTPDATVADVIESFDLTGDTTVYAVWSKDNGTINAKEKAEMRFGDTTTGSIRFKADVLANQRDDAEEYGFIVARLSHLTSYNEALTHNFINRTKSTRTPLYVEGVAYKRGGDIDTFYEKNENTGDVYISVACTNIPLSEIGVNDKLVTRPYYKYRINGKAVYVYGTAAEASLGDVAGAVDTSSSDYIRNKDYIDGILGLVKAD